MAPKRERTRLTVDKKYEIIQMLDRGEAHKRISEKYGIGLRTVCTIKSKREEIIKYFKSNSEACSSSTVVINSSHIHKDLNRLLRQWYIRCTAKGINLTGLMIQRKAHELNKQLKGSNTFKCSLRWVERFRQRHSLRKADLGKELETANLAAADIFKAEFHELLQKEGYRLENIYNAETTGLMWRAVPEKTLLSERVKLWDPKKATESVTMFLCANATGCHKLPILMIGTAEDPPPINSFYESVLSIMYKTNRNPYMDSTIFNEWFNECFLKLVTERQQKNGQREKTLLLLNNAGLDHERSIISTKDEFVKIMHFSYDAALLIQPMDRGIIACFKRLYRHEFLETLMPTSKSISERKLIQTFYELKLDDCCRMIHNAWLKITNPILKNAWNKLLNNESEESPNEFEILKKDIQEAIEKLNKMPGCEECDSIAVMDWFETDKKHNVDIHIDIKNTLIDFINVAMDAEVDEFIDENFQDILEEEGSP